ncbi:hypothetical protein [Pyxidicoccus xibeiensis]|uniref:hypothetical protein n=1 Tax=Pyxidicoccus xibeiensis TaxID=2906759 RepID=UPI0020A75FEF|nr:hypothetical protein [Pyxidicoccus xibeiensis]MCP3139981.1 hypothetical protein [Pyxidicoccus xibeiensis]
MKPAAESALHLLLARGDDHGPVLEEGLAASSTREVPKPEKFPDRVEVLIRKDSSAAPNDLPAQRWGVVAPQGPVGDALLKAIAPLLAYREQEQRAPVKQYRVPPDQDAAAAVKWMDQEHRARSVPEEEQPKYLLLLGDLHHVSLELQQVMAHSAYVGRVHVGLPDGQPDLAGYRAYAEKVLAYEQRTERDAAPEVLLYTARDGTSATEQGHTLLMKPSAEAIRTQWKQKHAGLEVTEVPYEAASPAGLLGRVGAARSGLLLSVAHGLGRPASGWASQEEQWALQGALSLGPGCSLTGQSLRNTPFLPGGLWFSVACFGAATPAKSAFHSWLSLLARAGVYGQRPDVVLENLPKPGERPFLSALPQALLANPRGPLAVIGHCDLAWTLGFADAEDVGQSRAERILSALRVLVKGSRVGVALDALMQFYRDVNFALMDEQQLREDARLDGTPDPFDPKRHGMRWMLRNDLRGYLLLGDPAARLSLRHAGS